MKELNEAQRLASEIFDRPICVVASAGSGKTTVLLQRYLNLLKSGLKPHQILTVTFTKKAAAQLKSRVVHVMRTSETFSEKMIEAVSRSGSIATVHSFCFRLINQFGTDLHLGRIQSLLTQHELLGAFEHYFDEWLETLPINQLEGYLKYLSYEELRSVAREVFSKAHQCKLLTTQELSDLDYTENFLALPLLHSLFEVVRNSLKKRWAEGTYSFDDLEHLSLLILKKSPPALSHMQNKYKAILVDEFQDTSSVQWEIFQHLVGKDFNKLFIVGDPKQSIYRFRFADVKQFKTANALIQTHRGEIITMNTNYRSQPALIKALNTLAKPLFEKSDIDYLPMQSQEEQLDESAIPPVELLAYEEVGNREALLHREVLEVTQKIKELLKAKQPSDLAILFRVSEHIPFFHSHLISEGIPSVCKKTRSLFRLYEVGDILSYLRVLYDPLDNLSLASFLRSPYMGLSYTELFELFTDTGGSLFEGLLHKQLPSTKWLLEIVEASEFELKKVLDALFTHTSYWPKDESALMEFLSILTAYDGNLFQLLPLLDMFSEVEFMSDNNDTEHSQEAVQLMTVHSAKGLEFDTVFLVDNLRQGARHSPVFRFSTQDKIGIKVRDKGESVPSANYEALRIEEYREDTEEAKRLLYVAMTRAKQKLFIALPKNAKRIPKESWAYFFMTQYPSQFPEMKAPALITTEE